MIWWGLVDAAYTIYLCAFPSAPSFKQSPSVHATHMNKYVQSRLFFLISCRNTYKSKKQKTATLHINTWTPTHAHTGPHAQLWVHATCKLILLFVCFLTLLDELKYQHIIRDDEQVCPKWHKKDIIWAFSYPPLFACHVGILFFKNNKDHLSWIPVPFCFVFVFFFFILVKEV